MGFLSLSLEAQPTLLAEVQNTAHSAVIMQNTNRYSDRHEPILCVVARVPIFWDRGTILCALPSESVTTPDHVPFKIGIPPRPVLPKKKVNHVNVAGIRLFQAPMM